MSEVVETAVPAPDFGETRQLAPGVQWLRLPLPFPPRHINVYLLDDGTGEPFLVDTGYAGDETAALWESRYDAPGRVVVTHFHPDHIGQAGHLSNTGARVYMSREEWDKTRILQGLPGEQVDASLREFFTRNGMHCDDSMFGRGNGYRRSVPQLPEAVTTLEEGRLPFAADWDIHFARGHSPAHVVLFREKDPVLACGDVVLPRITPNISVWPDEPDADPLGHYFNALKRLRGLPEDTLVLPAHGLPYTGLHARIEELLEHHDERLQELRELLTGRRCTAMQALPTLFPKELKPGSVPFAFGETLAHLNRLWYSGDAERITGDDDRYYYRLAA